MLAKLFERRRVPLARLASIVAMTKTGKPQAMKKACTAMKKGGKKTGVREAVKKASLGKRVVVWLVPPKGKTVKKPAAMGKRAVKGVKKDSPKMTVKDKAGKCSKKAKVHGDDDDTDDEEEELPNNDKSSITKQQRHVWGKAMAGLPDTPAGLPKDVHEAFNKMTKPAAKNMLINSIVPKTVGYSDQVNVTTIKMEQFKAHYVQWGNKDICAGMTETEMACYLGGGDMQKGILNLAQGVEEKHIIEKNGLMYLKRGEISRQEVHKEGWTGSKNKPLGDGDWQQVCDEFSKCDWAKFAFLNKRSEIVPANFSEQKRPASDEAQEHLQDAFDSVTHVVSGVRSQCREIVKKQRESPGKKSDVLTSAINNAVEKAGELEKTYISKTSSLLTNENDTTTDAEIKKLLAGMSGPFKEMMSLQRDITALSGSLKRKSKDDDDAEATCGC